MRLLASRPTAIWCLLVLATLISWRIGHAAGDDVRRAGIVILVVAFAKVRFVILEFMELRHAPLPLRLIGESWVVIVCALLVWLLLEAPVPG